MALGPPLRVSDVSPMPLVSPVKRAFLNNKHRQKAKVFKSMEQRKNFVLGKDVFMDKVESLCHRDLVGWPEYVKLDKGSKLEWVTRH